MTRSSFHELKARQAVAWSSAPFDRMVHTLAPMHDELLRRLEPRWGEQWLDVATGTGRVALEAARAGAVVTGVDIADRLIDTAKQLGAEAGLSARFEVGDAEHLPYPDASFDVVASSVGVMFAPDHAAAARELGRVCRPGGRLGLTAWRLEGGVGDFFRLMAPFQPSAVAGAGDPFDWGDEQHVTGLLAPDFELEFDELDAPHTAESGEAAWAELSSFYGPTKTLSDSLGPMRRLELQRAVVEFYEAHRSGARVHHQRRYLLVLGSRR